MASANFTHLARIAVTPGFDWSTVTCKAMLVSAVPSQANLDAWEFRSDVTTEITGTGYTAGGKSQPFTVSAIDTTNNRQEIAYTSMVNAWTGATFNTVGAIIYIDTGLASTDNLLHFLDFGGTKSPAADPFGYSFNTQFYVNANA